ncbi:2-keto-gluconate dehydrogenase [Colletotrichum camelliae]|nr:2-keto-gluconate dehydrogenase [Colletotrichum camelliae]
MVMTKDYFIDNSKLEGILDEGEYDYIVVGSGCTALAFIQEVLRKNEHARILCLERGEFWLPAHFQNLPLPFKTVLGGPSETFPWTLSKKTFSDPLLKFCHGSCPFFGGRSLFWSAWSPQPKVKDMRDFPKSMIDSTEKPEFWELAKDLLHVTGADEIGDSVYSGLQREIDGRLKEHISGIATAEYSEPAQLAVGQASVTSNLRFNKFSTPAPLLKLYEEQKSKNAASLDILLNCTVKTLGAIDDDEHGHVHSIETTRGTITWQGDSTKVILCAGAFPAATILLNSFPQCRETVGKRVSGHFLTHIVARAPLSAFNWIPVGTESDKKRRLEIAAHYLAGKDSGSGQQYHVQITAIQSPDPKMDAEDAARECPDYAAAATYEQLEHSTEHVVFVCATLGEFSERNLDNWFRPDPSNPDVTTNMKLQYTLTKSDRQLWDTMDKATYQTIEKMVTPAESELPSGSEPSTKAPESVLEYWHNDGPDTNKGSWKAGKPDPSEIRIPGIVHETSTAFMGSEPSDGSSVGPDYSVHGVPNVFVTGGALFPTAGSWNPTLTMCGFAQDLARQLENERH